MWFNSRILIELGLVKRFVIFVSKHMVKLNHHIPHSEIEHPYCKRTMVFLMGISTLEPFLGCLILGWEYETWTALGPNSWSRFWAISTSLRKSHHQWKSPSEVMYSVLATSEIGYTKLEIWVTKTYKKQVNQHRSTHPWVSVAPKITHHPCDIGGRIHSVWCVWCVWQQNRTDCQIAVQTRPSDPWVYIDKCDHHFYIFLLF